MTVGDLLNMPLLDLLKLYDDCTIRCLGCDKCPLSNIGVDTEDCTAPPKLNY